jgi:hypothetical protein
MNHPLLYEVNTRCWLQELSTAAGRSLSLAEVPEAEIQAWRERGFTHIWLMGVWETGPLARKSALETVKHDGNAPGSAAGVSREDVGASPYALADYTVAAGLGGDEALAKFRQRLRASGIGLVLDFVPNHLGLDHHWIGERTELFVNSPVEMPETFKVETPAGPRWVAHGKDPNFPAWRDTAQLDYRNPATRKAMIGELLRVAARCDGVRCDMAMLELNEIFARDWAKFPFVHPMDGREFWAEAITTVRRTHTDFMLLAEAYWGLESCLQTLGFNFTYDKALYDELAFHDPSAITHHLLDECSASFIANSAHFLENHDERRAASIFYPAEHRAAALLVLGLPGLRLLHGGQLEGAQIRTPVQLLRRQRESPNAEVEKIYNELLRGLQESAVGRGEAALLRARAAWPNNQTWRNFILVQWQSHPGEFDLVVVNLVPQRGQCYVPLTVPELAQHHWSVRDRLGTERHYRVGADLERQGFFLDVGPYAAQLFHFEPSQ